MLTRKQRDLLAFIHKRVQRDGVPPSFDEMKDALELKSKSGIHRLITALEERGFIRRLPHRARAIEVIKVPDSMPPRRRGFVPEVIQGSAAPEPAVEAPVVRYEGASVPVVGRIAAGVPIEAIESQNRMVAVPPDMLRSGEHFALEVRGDSMIDAGILDGDTVVIQRGDSADNGEIVVALVQDHEATLKRLRRKGGSIALEAENPAYETRIYAPDDVRIQGRLVGLVRRY